MSRQRADRISSSRECVDSDHRGESIAKEIFIEITGWLIKGKS